MKAAPAIGFGYRASRLLIIATLAAAALALLAIWLSGLPRPAGLVLSLSTAACAGAALESLLRPRVRTVLWRTDGGADITLNDRLGEGRREVQGTLRAVRVVGPLIALTLRWPPRGGTTLWLLPDNLDADTRRRLRMRLGAVAGRLASGNADSG